MPSRRWRSSSSNRPCLRPICSWIVLPPCALSSLVHSLGAKWVSLTTYGLRAWIGEASASRAATAANTTVAKICIMNIGLESRWQTHPVASSSLDSYLSFSEAPANVASLLPRSSLVPWRTPGPAAPCGRLIIRCIVLACRSPYSRNKRDCFPIAWERAICIAASWRLPGWHKRHGACTWRAAIRGVVT